VVIRLTNRWNLTSQCVCRQSRFLSWTSHGSDSPTVCFVENLLLKTVLQYLHVTMKAALKISIFCDNTRRRLLYMYQRFREAWYLRLQGSLTFGIWWGLAAVHCDVRVTPFWSLTAYHLLLLLKIQWVLFRTFLKTEATRLSSTLALASQSAQRLILEDGNHHYRFEHFSCLKWCWFHVTCG
jgi:hypothetical protein